MAQEEEELQLALALSQSLAEADSLPAVVLPAVRNAPPEPELEFGLQTPPPAGLDQCLAPLVIDPTGSIRASTTAEGLGSPQLIAPTDDATDDDPANCLSPMSTVTPSMMGADLDLLLSPVPAARPVGTASAATTPGSLID